MESGQGRACPIEGGHQPKLDDSKIENLVRYLRSPEASSPQLAETLRRTADYFQGNAERMRYPQFRRRHLFVVSGVIEAGCKAVIGSRLKRSGMFWTVLGPTPSLLLVVVDSTQRSLYRPLGGPPRLILTFMSRTRLTTSGLRSAFHP
jgi:hypothetical protein